MKSSIKRRLRVFQFIMEHQAQCRDTFFYCGTHYSGYKKPRGERLVKLARKELYYSPKTFSGDIYNTLGRNYKKLYSER